MEGKNLKQNNLMAEEVVDINIIQVMRYLYTNRIILAIFTLAVPAITLLYLFFLQKPIYQSELVLGINLASKSGGISDKQFSYWFEEQEMLNKIHLVQQFFESNRFRRLLFDEIVEQSHLTDRFSEATKHKKLLRGYLTFEGRDPKSAYESLVGGLKVVPDRERYSMTVNATSFDPLIAVALVDLASMTLVEKNYQDILNRMDSLIDFLKEQTQVTEQRLEVLERELVQLQRQHQIVSTDSVARRTNEMAMRQRDQRTELQKQLTTKRGFLKVLRQELKRLRYLSVGDKKPSYAYVDQLQRRLRLLRYRSELGGKDVTTKERRQLEEKLKEYWQSIASGKIVPDLNVEEQIKRLEKSIVEFDDEVEQLSSELKAQNHAIRKSTDQLLDLPPALQKIAKLQRNIDLQANLYGSLKTKLQEALITQAGRTNDLVILAESEIPESQSGHRYMSVLILASLVGFSLGALVLFLMFILVPLVRDSEDLEKVGLEVIGSFPWYRENPSRLLQLATRPPLVIKSAPNSVESNAIRYTRFRLEKVLNLNSKDRQEGTVLTVSSVNPNEGKSYTTSNLAYALALADFKVLMIDLDLAQPHLQSYYPEAQGSENNAIINEDQRVNFQLKTVIKGLDLIDTPIIQENVCDFLESELFRRFLGNLKEEYDVVILDTPPMEGHLEPLLAAQYSDALLMVVNQRRTLMEDLSRITKEVHQNLDIPTLAVLNFVFEDIKTIRRRHQNAG